MRVAARSLAALDERAAMFFFSAWASLPRPRWPRARKFGFTLNSTYCPACSRGTTSTASVLSSWPSCSRDDASRSPRRAVTTRAERSGCRTRSLACVRTCRPIDTSARTVSTRDDSAWSIAERSASGQSSRCTLSRAPGRPGLPTSVWYMASAA